MLVNTWWNIFFRAIFFIDLWLGRLEWTKDCLCRQVPFKHGGTPLYKPCRYVPPQKGRVFAPFWSENGFPHFGPESKIGYGFPWNFESLRKYLLFQFQMSSKEREIREFEMDFKKSFLLLF